MRRTLLCCVLFAAGVATWASGAKNDDKPLPLADPYVFYEDGLYYAYGTTSDQGIEVYTSRDLRTWELHGWALHPGASTASRWYWAPEVYHLGDRYLMYFSGNEEIRAAWADSPYGPFQEVESGPLWKWGDGRFNIDNHLYIDNDGTPYIFFVEGCHPGTSMARLQQDFTTIIPESFHHVITPEQSWELLDGRVNEGPFVIQHKGTYYLTYSGNGYTCQDYAIGVATANQITGPWTKVDYNPVLRRVHGLVGVGHHSIFRDKKGQLRIAFHAHKSETEVHPRDMHIAYLKFRKNPKGGPDILYVDTKRIIDCKVKL